MNPEDRAALLEALAFGPDVSAGDRLRALELAREPGDGRCRCFEAEVALDGDELDRETDAYLAVDVIRTWLGIESPLTDGLRERFPQTLAELDHGFALRVEQRAAEIADAGGIERRISKEAEKRAASMYSQRAFRAVPSLPENPPGDGEGNAVSQPPETLRTPLNAPGVVPLGIDLEAGWPKARTRNPNIRRLGDRRRS